MLKNKALVAPLRESVEPLNAEGYQQTIVSFNKELRFEMSDASGPQKNKVLESNVVEMKIELFHIRAQIEQIMGMMHQLLQTRSADGGQQEEKSGGTGRGDANNDSGGAGRAPREEGAAGARVGVTRATTAGGKVYDHNSTASDGSRPADDTGRRPEVPAGVSPIIDMQRGDARYSFLAGIATHNGGSGVLSSGFQRQPHVAPPVLKGKKGESQTFNMNSY